MASAHPLQPQEIGVVGRHEAALAELLERVRREVPFYASHLGDTSTRSFAELPTFSKADLRAFGSFPLQGAPVRAAHRYAATSGTTGPRLFVGYSDNDWRAIGAQLRHRAAAVGLTATDTLANTHGYGLWVGGPALDLMANVAGAALLPLGPGHTDQLLEWIGDMPISATPSFMRFLTERIVDRDIDISSWQLRVGLIGGETSSIALRQSVVDVLGPSFAWQELYGMTETGGPVLGWAPPADLLGGRLLFDTDEFVVELLRPDRDEPAAIGEIGEITLTTPTRELAPLIRYRTRDLTIDTGSRSEDGFPIVHTVIGRVDDALKVRGALVYPGVIEAVVLAHCSNNVEWRIVVDRAGGEMDELIVVIDDKACDPRHLGQIVSDSIRVRCSVELVPTGTLERFEGKAKRIIDRRPS